MDTSHISGHISDQAGLRRLLEQILTERGESLGTFGATLAATLAPDKPAFTRQYIYALRTGRAAITWEIAGALAILAAMLDGQSELQARARPVTVPLLSLHDLPEHTVIEAPARSCALAGCRISFVAASPRQRYCCPQCRREAHRRAN